MEAKKISEIVDYGFKIGIAQIREELIELIHVLIHEKPNNFLEIGSKLGGNLYILSEFCKGIKISVDLFEGEHGGWILQDHPYLGDIAKKRNRFFNNLGIHTVLNNSHDEKTLNKINKLLGKEKLGLLYIDGDHTYEGTKLDYDMYSPLVRSGGLIVFHDINETDFHKKANNQVYKFWKELQGKKIELTANEHWGGIGILCV